MENIYNHNVSAEEINVLSKLIPGRKIDEKSVYEKSVDNDVCSTDLFRLYSIRGNNQKAMEFFKKIKGPTLQYLLKEF